MNEPNEPLFRPEVLEARRRGWLGGISLAQPLSLWVLTCFATLAATVIVLFLVFGEYTRRSRVEGQLVPDLGLATVVAPVAGVVAQPMPKEGEQVESSQALVMIATPRATSEHGDMTAGLLEVLETQQAGIRKQFDSQFDLLSLQRAGYQQQLTAAEQSLKQLDAAIATQRKQVAIASDMFMRFRKLAEQNYVSQLALAQQEQATLEQQQSLQSLRRQAISARREFAQLRQSLRELPKQHSLQTGTRMHELAELDQQRLQVQAGGEVLVKAPVSGVITSRLIDRGQTVQAGQPLLSILPAGSRLQAQLLVPSRAVAFIEPGDTVVLRYRAFPHQKFGHHEGRVIQISRNALSPQGLSALVGDMRAGEPYYRVLVELSEQSIMAYGKPEPLLPGMLVEADILGETRRLYEWVLEPLYSLTGRL